jgi:dTDP-4-dehydrorhamnose 3,5-epimerase-like enzyme
MNITIVSEIIGGIHEDNRGRIGFVNDFDLHCIKRFYTITHSSTKIFRGWQGHKKETKYFFVVKGTFKIFTIKIDSWNSPSSSLPLKESVLSDTNSKVLCVPGGFVTGIMAQKSDSRMLVLSDRHLEDSLVDDFRYDQGLWPLS